MKKYPILVFLILFAGKIIAQSEVQQYREPFSKSYPIRTEQHLEMKAYAEALLKEEVEKSLVKFQPDFFSIENYRSSLFPYRQQLADYFGYPPSNASEGKVSKFEKVGEDRYSNVYRAWIEVAKGLTAYGIYMVPKNIKGKVPLIVAIHGGGGNPEAICGLDTRINYHAFGYEAVKRGYIVWAPGLTMLSAYSGDKEIPGVSRDIIDKQLKLSGSSIIGVEIHKIIESTKTLIKKQPEIDANNVGMTGLSWGGYFTMYTTALCPFIKAAAISGNFKDTRSDLLKTMDNNLVNTLSRPFESFGYFQAIGMICPRPCYVQLGENDGLFGVEGAQVEAERAGSFYKKLGIQDKFEFEVHPGGHEFEIESIFDFFGKYLK